MIREYRARGEFDANEFIKRYSINGSVPPPYSYYLYLNDSSSYGMPKKARNNAFISTDIFHLNRLVLKKLEYTYYHLMSFIEMATNLKNENPLHFSNVEQTLWIEEQLSWLGLKYDPACWISGNPPYATQPNAEKKKFEDLLELHCRDGETRTAMSELQQDEFQKAFWNFISTNYPRSSYIKRKASPKTINNVLSDLEYPFKVTSERRSLNGKQLNYWYVEKWHWEKTKPLPIPLQF